jgi:hypothetical protein
MNSVQLAAHRANRSVQSKPSDPNKQQRISPLAIFEIADHISEAFPEGSCNPTEIAKLSDTINSEDGYEAIQIIWGPVAVIFSHLLLTEQARLEHQSGLFLRSWCVRTLESREVVVDRMRSILEMRAEQRVDQIPLAISG